MEKKQLPIGIRTFREVREGGYYYVDKTMYIDRLVREGANSFYLSRPRQFGKCLFISTLKEAFEGNEKLFTGLDLHDKWDWSTHYPVVHLDFSTGDCARPEDIDDMIVEQLREVETKAGLTTKAKVPEVRLIELIQGLYEKTGQRVVLLVDECDKPIISTFDNPNTAVAIRNRLRGLYGVTEYGTKHIRFSFFTGECRIAKVCLSTGEINHFDISISKDYSSICGYTDADVDKVFAHEIEGLNRDEVREWYNGYSWSGEEKMYNPYDILHLLDKRKYDPWWLKSGSPNILIDTLERRKVRSIELMRKRSRWDLLKSFDAYNADIESRLFQAGYLSIASMVNERDAVRYMLDFPNRIVREYLNHHILNDLLPGV